MKKTHKILITASTYPRWKGDSTPPFVQQFAHLLAKDGYKMQVLAPHAKDAKVHENDNGVDVYRYRYFYPESLENVAYGGGGVYKIKKTPLYAIKLLCFITSLFIHMLYRVIFRKVDVLNPHWAIPQGFIAVFVKFLTGKKVVLTVHGGDVFNLNGKIMTMVKRFVLKHSDVVCPNSSATRDICNAICKREYKIVPMGIDMNKFKTRRPLANLKKELGLGKFTILFVGRLSEVKGVIYLCEALEKLKQDDREFKALIAGEGPLKEELMKFVSDRGLNANVKFVGWLKPEEVPDYYGVADVFVGPSLSEPQGLVFIESLASGTPVIASKVGGLVDIVSDGENGYLVQPKSPDAIYEKLTYLMNNPAKLKEFSSRARPLVEKRFSWEATVNAYDDIFKKVNS